MEQNKTPREQQGTSQSTYEHQRNQQQIEQQVQSPSTYEQQQNQPKIEQQVQSSSTYEQQQNQSQIEQQVQSSSTYEQQQNQSQIQQQVQSSSTYEQQQNQPQIEQQVQSSSTYEQQQNQSHIKQQVQSSSTYEQQQNQSQIEQQVQSSSTYEQQQNQPHIEQQVQSSSTYEQQQNQPHIEQETVQIPSIHEHQQNQQQIPSPNTPITHKLQQDQQQIEQQVPSPNTPITHEHQQNQQQIEQQVPPTSTDERLQCNPIKGHQQQSQTEQNKQHHVLQLQQEDRDDAKEKTKPHVRPTQDTSTIGLATGTHQITDQMEPSNPVLSDDPNKLSGSADNLTDPYEATRHGNATNMITGDEVVCDENGVESQQEPAARPKVGNTKTKIQGFEEENRSIYEDRHFSFRDVDMHQELFKKLEKRLQRLEATDSLRLKGFYLPPEILRMDGRSIELYTKALDEGKAEVHDIRVMVVGHFDVGKTTLTKRLLGENVNIGERNSTDGIDVHVKRCRVSLESGEWEVKAKGLHKDDSTARIAMVIQEHPSLIGSPSHHDETDAYIYESDNDISFKSEGSERLSLDQATTRVMEDIKLLVQNLCIEEIQDINEYANLSIWDFAGQYAFYGTHQIFLSRRAVYLLVIDLSQPMDSSVQDDACMDAEGIKTMKISEFVEFWLKSIHFYTKEEKTVILVGTRADKLKEEGREDEAQILFDKLRDHLSGKSFSYCLSEHEFVIDNRVVDTNLDYLKKAIFEVAKSKTDYWGESIPCKWLTLERILVTRKNDKIIERRELEQLNQELCVPLDESEELDLFLRFQHECGLILYFSEESLRDYIVLDPQWLIDAFKCFITTDMFMKKDMKLRPLWKKFNENGVLTQEFIDQSWNHCEDKQFYKHKNHLLGLMEKLDIISRPISFTDQEGKLPKLSLISESDYFTPCMLKEQPPTYLLDPTQIHHSTSTSKLCYTFESQFIPPAIFHRLLAASMSKWEPRQKEDKVLLYCGCGVFDLNSSRSHQLTIYYRENYVQIWLTRYSAKQCDTEQLRSLCLDVREQVEKFLHKVCDSMMCSRDDIRTFIKCPRAHYDDSKGMIELATLEEYFDNEYCCSMHGTEHVLEPSDICGCWSRHEKAPIKVLQAQYLDRLLTEIDVATMSPRIGLEWKQIGRKLGLSNSEIEHCVMDNLNTVNRISAMLNKWRNQSSNPTLRELKSAIQSSNGDVVKIFEGFERMEEV